MKALRLVGFTICFLAFFVAQAQKNFKKDADFAYNAAMYFKAKELYDKAYEKSRKADEKAEILFMIGECWRQTQNPKDAEVWYTKAIKARYNEPQVYLYLAHAQKVQGKYDEALDNFKKYLEKKPGDKLGEVGVKSCEQAIEWRDNPTRYVVNPMPLLNSEAMDFSPVFADKKNEQIYFTSTREGSTGGNISDVSGGGFADLWESTRDKKGKWSEPVILNEVVNSEVDEGASCLNGRRNTIYFTRCGFDKKKGKFGCALWTARKAGANFRDPEIIPIANDTNAVGHPAITPDDKVLIFASDLVGPGAQGGKDLWYITYDKKERKWSDPVNLGSEINTPGDEMFPYVRDDGTLFFASNGHLGMGGLDIFEAKAKGTNQWGDPVNMKAPINSSANDYGIIWDGDKKRGFFTSDREGGKGKDDIYEFYWPPVVFALEGVVKDLETKKPIPSATVQLVGTDGSKVEVQTDDEGFFKFAENGQDRYIKKNTSYSLVVSKDKYLNAKGRESTVGVEESKVFYHEYELQPITEKPIELPEILYEYNKADLLPQSKDSLNYLYKILIENPTIVIELRANTDFRGSNSYNQKLSQRRAQACVDYLVTEKGIAADRIEAKGQGESVPRELKRDMRGFKAGTVLTEKFIKSLKDKQQIEDAHQLNRRTEFAILRTDYVPKKEETPKDEGEGTEE